MLDLMHFKIDEFQDILQGIASNLMDSNLF